MHTDAGVKVHTSTSVKHIDGKDGAVKSVTLQDGTVLDADLVICGLGVTPNTQFLADSGVDLTQDGGVICDPFLGTSAKDVYAAGDIASFPNWVSGGRQRVEHWVVALDQGTFAAFNMLNKLVPYGEIPFFWTRFYEKSI
mmetsp:Transcript_9188/g.6537  ORF Transcript_9188/g.6537 Transcript_9188/m.6537 type:complete len:140 (+) Transcript_9188:1229-1648(+)|eukprot:CAMPEP_0116881766 /NCGR_PEP_ID=MMETSP0463-20121206/13823_1 /TAXON_ID=181622 /ORGANISM="Strombidinopsis sp, Strain SopsisLIS2011" /LENGTH=139 /DNA_ID=CAMNT_0004533929 /DNA_START=1122 /DNA_END=1541 /DNA_ORIENTATION=-